jgi:hypothetical protein
MMVRPIARRSSVSVTCWVAPGAALPRRRVRRNSSVSASTRFMCCKKVRLSNALSPCDTHLVECQHLSNHLPTVLKCYLHAVVDLRPVSSMRFGAEVGALTRFCYIIRRQSVPRASSLRSRTRAAGRFTYHLSLSIRGARHDLFCASEDDLNLDWGCSRGSGKQCPVFGKWWGVLRSCRWFWR